MSKRHFLLAGLLIVSALALAACGSSGSDDEAKIEEAIETSATAHDPKNCTELETQNFVEQSSGESGKAALKTCEEEAEETGNEAESVEVSEVEVNGGKATAQAAITGGSLESQTVKVALVEEGGNWKLDELTGFVHFEAGPLIEQIETELEKAGELSGEQTSCIIEGVEEDSKSELEELVLSGDSTPIQEIAEGC